jgi:ParB-like chromosome segregation protein Spo0J
MTRNSAADYLDPSTLVAWDRNPRHNQHAIQQVANSIQRFGFAAPIVARAEDLRVIAGHTRLAAALQLGLKRVPVRLLDITKSEADALALADNRLGELAEWDTKGLADVLAELEDASGLGWSDAEISGLLTSLEAPGFPEFDEDIPVEHSCPKCGYTWSGATS